MYQLTSAGANPLSLAEARQYLRDPDTADDPVIQRLIDMAAEYGERYTGRQFRANTWTLTLPDFPDEIRLRKPPVSSITSVTRLVGGVVTAVSAADYYLTPQPHWGLLQPVPGAEWPSDGDDREDAVVITFVTEPYYQNALIKSALLRHAAQMYADRGDCSDVVTAAIEGGAQVLYNSIRIPRV